ncbi:hypothetical protein PSU4_39720 [Pseudonocardia sulfidoxydans NBRC 16205]|uniref:Tubulin-like protein n=1 Tax=Pseudonocardia sulfidoxydans NBRC 16205 TaxID=1223511 RepID=A0A511DPN8_9PSEU|nr:tubulin-like doman-containing protein [Pseudonocardia sulfidoxydans]GEL25018.1 hypothetical protein PSU4_39720 [Pseudonocardia sulfidoxydans NBRC 16205]
MSGLSLYHSATGKQAPHCIHAVGIGKTGAQMIDALLRTGELEDMLDDPRARFTALSIDIGDADMAQMRQYGDSFIDRLRDREIPTDRAQIRTVNLSVPSADELYRSLSDYPEWLGKEFPRFDYRPAFQPWLTSSTTMPKADKHYVGQLEVPGEEEHFPRAVAKAIYGSAYYGADRTLANELDDFARSIDQTRLPSIVLVFFGIGGGTGSGMVVDLARHLTNVRLGRRVPVVGVGLLPCSGDPEYQRGASVYATLNDLDCMLDETKNNAITSVWGDLYKNPFNGGFLALPQEHAWERLHRYTTIKKGVLPEVRHQQALHVTNKFVDDSFCRYVLHDYGRELFRVLRPSGYTGAPHERVSPGARNWTLFDVAKLTHPGVQVLPGEPMSKWRDMISTWIGFIPQYLGVREGFKTDYIEAHTFSARSRWNDTMENKLQDTLKQFLLPGEDGTLTTSQGEFFDELTVYTNVVVPGVARPDLTAFHTGRDAYDALPEQERILQHSFLLELGIALNERNQEFGDYAGMALGEGGIPPMISYDDIRGEASLPSTGVEIQTANIAAAVTTVVPTP